MAVGIENRVCAKLCDRIPLRYPCAVVCLVLILWQGLVLDHYLAQYKGALWWLWVISDVVVCAVFITAFVQSFKLLKTTEVASKSRPGGELPLGYVAWFIYSVLLAAKVAIIFEDIAWQLEEKDVFGPNTLKTIIAFSALVFWLLVATHHNADAHSERHTFIVTISHTVTLNLLDTVAILDVLFIQESHIFLTFSMHRVINGIACLNLILPAIPLLVLSRTQFGVSEATKPLKTAHTLLNLLFINLPLFIIRMFLWHSLDKNISVFLIKNVMGMCFTARTLWDTWLKPPSDQADGKRPTGELEMSNLAAAVEEHDVIHDDAHDPDKPQGSETFI